MKTRLFSLGVALAVTAATSVFAQLQPLPPPSADAFGEAPFSNSPSGEDGYSLLNTLFIPGASPFGSNFVYQNGSSFVFGSGFTTVTNPAEVPYNSTGTSAATGGFDPSAEAWFNSEGSVRYAPGSNSPGSYDAYQYLTINFKIASPTTELVSVDFAGNGLASKKWTPIQAALMSFSLFLFSKATGEI
jgi:hypothetical protein